MANINDIKQKVYDMHGKRVDCEINKGRNKIVRTNVLIQQVYPSMFVVEPTVSVDLDKKSFSYSDVMCGVIKFL